MSKKWIIIVSAGAAVLLVAVAASWVVLRPKSSGDVAADIGSPVALDNNSTPSSISLEDKPKDPNGLSVTSGGSQGLPTQNQPGDSGNNSSSSSDSGKVDLKQFDQYVNETTTRYKDEVTGSGPSADAGKTVIINFRGALTDGQLFEDSYAAGKPIQFQIGAHTVIAGLEQGVVGMKVGGKRLIIVPPALGYGKAGKDPIPGNAVMVFEVELVGVQ